MRPAAEIIWCGVSAPVLQGIFVGLGIAAVGLVIFPFDFNLTRPPAGRQSDFGRAKALLRWGRWLAWLVGALTLLTLAGYVILYSWAGGRFCTARLDQREQFAVFVWSWLAAATFLVLAASGVLRWLARRRAEPK